MLRRKVGVSVCGALLLSSVVVAAKTPPIKPMKPWVLDYAEAQCLASRDYGTPDDPMTLAIRPAPNGETYELIVLRNSPPPKFAEELKGTIDFGQGPIKAWLLHYAISSKKRDGYQFRISAAEMAQARAATSVTLQIKGGPTFGFPLDSIPALLNQLSACTADLKQYWNMDGVKGGSIAISSKGDLRRIFTANDYPWEAESRSQEGKAQFLLLIDEKGDVAACHVLVPSGVPALDAMGCIAMQQRAKFKPARDSSGRAIRSTVTTPPVIWRMG